MFKKLGGIAEGKIDLLTVRCTNAWLQAGALYVNLSDDMEAITSSAERLKHFRDDSWLKDQLGIWETLKTATTVATPEHPLEVITGDVALVLVIEGKKYLVSFFRDINPIGYLIAGGCPKSMEELLNPRITAIREAAQEVLIADKTGRVYNISPSQSRTELNINLVKWKLAPIEIISVMPKELPAGNGHAQRLVIIKYGDRQSSTSNVNITISPEIASVAATFYQEVELPISFNELRLFDGETRPNGTLLNRPVRLTDKDDKVAAIFFLGYNILTDSWALPSFKQRMFIPGN